MLRGVSGGRGGRGGDMLIVEGVDGGSGVSESGMQHAPVELEEQHAGRRVRCGVQRGHRGGEWGGRGVDRKTQKDAGGQDSRDKTRNEHANSLSTSTMPALSDRQKDEL